MKRHCHYSFIGPVPIVRVLINFFPWETAKVFGALPDFTLLNVV